MTTSLAPRPANEERRAKAVIQTGLIDNPKPELFQVYCDLAKDITDFDSATFSLFDNDFQCGMANAGRDDYEVGGKGERHSNNICSYVLLSSDPLLMPDLREDPTWKNHPAILDGSSIWLGYAGFPVINRDNYALGTLCMLHKSPKALSENVIPLVQKITKNIAFLLDIQTDQKQLTSEKMLEAASAFQKDFPTLTLSDFKLFLGASAGRAIDKAEANGLIIAGLLGLDAGEVTLTRTGRNLQESMKIQPKPLNRIKISGSDATEVLDEMLSKLN
ncbi:MAG: GAF domain-containing protein [Candidatus Puniceispirillaceae bacterium]